jgi:hypothetical protein
MHMMRAQRVRRIFDLDLVCTVAGASLMDGWLTPTQDLGISGAGR